MSNSNLSCRYCSSTNTVKAGKRETKAEPNQIWRCNDCRRKFSNSNKTNKRTDPDIILSSLILSCHGNSLDDIAITIKKKNNKDVSKSAISKWIREYNPRYLEIRHINKQHRKIVENHLFQHSGINYNYRYHIPKLNMFCRYKELKNYLINVPKLKQELFENSKKSSQLKMDLRINLRENKNTVLSRTITKILAFSKSPNQRHEIIENYLLNCDRDTIATEVPVYFYDKNLGNISGHIDILQVKDGKIFILDYKPEAIKENKEKTITQLNLYALALSFRTKIPLNNFVCAYFDQNDYLEFRPRYSLGISS